MTDRRLAHVQWYCVRIDHIARRRSAEPVLTTHQEAWAYCRSGARDDDHVWADTRGAPLYELYREPATQLAHRSPVVIVEALKDELREMVGLTSCVFDLARRPVPLRISFDEPAPGQRGAAARVSVDLADAHGSVGMVSLADVDRSEYSSDDIDLTRSIVAFYAEPIRRWIHDASEVTARTP